MFKSKYDHRSIKRNHDAHDKYYWSSAAVNQSAPLQIRYQPNMKQPWITPPTNSGAMLGTCVCPSPSRGVGWERQRAHKGPQHYKGEAQSLIWVSQKETVHLRTHRTADGFTRARSLPHRHHHVVSAISNCATALHAAREWSNILLYTFDFKGEKIHFSKYNRIIF